MLFLFKDSDVKVRLSSCVVDYLKEKVQKQNEPEYGGMLFTKCLTDPVLQIDLITSPTPHDNSSQNSFQPSEEEWQKIIEEKYLFGYHYVGDWHTHYQCRPSPSGKDKRTIKKVFNESQHSLNFMIMLIRGNGKMPYGLYLALTDGRRLYPREP